MQKSLQTQSVKLALQRLGWTQKDLAREIGVTAQAVTNWFKGEDFPRPDKLLKLAVTLGLGFDELVCPDAVDAPVVAFRKKGGSQTTSTHIKQAMAMGALLKPLVGFLPDRHALRLQIPAPSSEYAALQAVANEIRSRIGLSDQSVLSYEHLIDEFGDNGAIIVPILWGDKDAHQNALHILLPQEQVTFIYLNLDARLEDFKFWMAHELAHVYTPTMAGTPAGESFADALAGALLFPQAVVEIAYAHVARQRSVSGEIREIQRQAKSYTISLITVFCELRRYVQAHGLAPLRVQEKDIHALRDAQQVQSVSRLLFGTTPPQTADYIAVTQDVFRSPFMPSLKRMIKQHATPATYIQQIMDIPMADAVALHGELCR